MSKKPKELKRFVPEFRPQYVRVVMQGKEKSDPVRCLMVMDIRYAAGYIEVEVANESS